MKNRVLIIEDDRDLAEALSEMVSMLGHHTAVAHTGDSGFDLAASFQPDIVFCDLTLPGQDGFTTARALRAHPVTARARLIALSGDASVLERDPECFDSCLLKPIGGEDIEKLLAAG